MTREVPAVGRALDILELFLAHPVLSTPQIAQRTGLPRTTAHELVHTLTSRGYLRAEPGAPVRYRLAPRLCQLGAAAAERLDLAGEATTTAREVATASGETAHVAVLEGTEVVYIAKQDSDHPVRMVSAVGRRLPAHCTAVGKVLLSDLDPAAVAARYPANRELPALTAGSIRTLPRLQEELARVRREQVAYDDCEANEAVACVAAPVREHSGAIVAALSISVPTLRWSPARRAELTELVCQGAASLSARLGGGGAPAAG